jgi:hypothetical protein
MHTDSFFIACFALVVFLGLTSEQPDLSECPESLPVDALYANMPVGVTLFKVEDATQPATWVHAYSNDKATTYLPGLTGSVGRPLYGVFPELDNADGRRYLSTVAAAIKLHEPVETDPMWFGGLPWHSVAVSLDGGYLGFFDHPYAPGELSDTGVTFKVRDAAEVRLNQLDDILEDVEGQIGILATRTQEAAP